MRPAYSVIFFTVSSGLGFGLLMLVGTFAVLGRLPADTGFALTMMALAFVSAITGLVSSTLHLGHPERAWRAFSQWRTSWLSREGVCAVATFAPALVFTFGWTAADRLGMTYVIAAGITVVLALTTVISTGMIYQRLPTIRAWADPLVTPGYIAVSLATASLWLAMLARAFGHGDPALTHLPFATVLVAWIIKVLYWWRLDRHAGGPTPATATGLGSGDARVRLLESPHTQENFVMHEMGYRVARRHAARLRRVAQGLTFLLPLALTEAAVLVAGDVSGISLAASALAAASSIAGALIERWLFFAEARHVVTLYYGAQRV